MVVDNTVQWLRLDLKETGLPVGFEYFTMNPNIPAGSLPLQGGLYSRLAYPDLWEWVQKQTGYLKTESEWRTFSNNSNGNVPFYSSGDGSTTFRVPSLQAYAKGSKSMDEVGTYLDAGLPNITGQTSYETEPQAIYDPTGAFYREESSRYKLYWSGGNTANASLSFDASKSNPIYGASTTVQPRSVIGVWCVIAYGTVTNIGNTDVVGIASGLTKVETRMSTMENTYNGYDFVVEKYINGTNWWRKWKSGWLEQGGQFAPPRNYTNTITFLKPFASMPTRCYVTYLGVYSTPDYANDSANVSYREVFPQAITATRFYLYGYDFGDNNAKYKATYYACGQGA